MQCRKWQLTINNSDKVFTRDKLKLILHSYKSIIYYCISDEIGNEGTYHTHIYVVFKNGVRFESLQKKFEGKAHLEIARGSSIENRDYIFKTGKWQDSEKKETSLPDTQEEWGEIPNDNRQGQRTDLTRLYGLIQDGLQNYDILQQHPEYMDKISTIDRVRLTIKTEENKKSRRLVETVYIFGNTGTGKTKYVMDNYEDLGICRITDYKNPFDCYMCEEVMVFEEFRTSLPISDMLNYLDIYPLTLPARYAPKPASYTKVFIITNIPLESQYIREQLDSPETWKAFLRRITKVIHMTEDEIIEYPSAYDYMSKLNSKNI